MHSNRSCGVSVAVGPRFRNFIKEVFVPPAGLTSRCGGVRLRTRTADLAFLVVHLPPRGAHSEESITRCVASVLKWLNASLDRLPNRNYPAIVGDINDQFGLVRTTSGGGSTSCRLTIVSEISFLDVSTGLRRRCAVGFRCMTCAWRRRSTASATPI